MDLPGYGFAKAAQQNKDTWSDFIAEYVKTSPSLALLCLLVDLRHPGLPIDRKAYEWLREIGIPLQIIGTKADKLGSGERAKNLREVQKLFPGENPPIAYSSQDNRGREELLRVIEHTVCGS